MLLCRAPRDATKSCNNARYSKTITNDNYQDGQKQVFTLGTARDHQFNINQNNHFIQARSVLLQFRGNESCS